MQRLLARSNQKTHPLVFTFNGSQLHAKLRRVQRFWEAALWTFVQTYQCGICVQNHKMWTYNHWNKLLLHINQFTNIVKANQLQPKSVIKTQIWIDLTRFGTCFSRKILLNGIQKYRQRGYVYFVVYLFNLSTKKMLRRLKKSRIN